MLPEQYIKIYESACDNSDMERDAFASDASLSPLWGETSDEELFRLFDICGRIYDVATGNVTDLADFAGLSHRQFAIRFGIPRRTMEDWSSGVRTPPDYVKLLLAESIGYFD